MPDTAAIDPSDELFDPDHVVEVRITLAAADWETLRHQPDQIGLLSTQIRGVRWEAQLLASDGLPSDCVLKPEWNKTVDRSAIGPRIATFPPARWPELAAALLDVLGLAEA